MRARIIHKNRGLGKLLSALTDLPALDADSDLLAITDGLQLGHADFDPRRVEVLEDDLRDMFARASSREKCPSLNTDWMCCATWA